ncbi:Tripeptidyl-peptidase 1 precursor protein [Lasiodiplodia theobromae]|uniref:Tripeptidyl-peptidase 1 precursor protein n=1 Tax=Lasiodiplodia theobromae TaxID=45133 RepID=UPI0015C33743|nr:Tripeptidyl-peptidase 1 precursor protein [Lasiodiplodia theobromae]KAF4546234.1 Tripeptidyl-peptidase 1 precursor protein [Lasiodiplodia theobromae]
MVRFTALLSVAAATQAVLATPIRARTPYAVKESHYVPRQWSKTGPAPESHVIHLHIGLKQSQFDELERHLYEVSDPDHYRYGQHLTAEHVNDLVKPSDEALKAVHEWLGESGVDVSALRYSPAQDWIDVTLPVADVEALLDTEYSVYQHEDGSRLIRTSKWSLPQHLHEHIDAIQPTTSFMRTGAQASNALELAPWVSASYTPPTNSTIAKVCNVSSVTPECFQNLYSTKGYIPHTGKSKVGFTNYLGEIPIRPDTELFLSKYRPDAVADASTFTQTSIADGPVQDTALNYTQAEDGISREANLDVQAQAGIAGPIQINSWSTGGSPPFNPDISTPTNTNEPYLVWLNYVLSLPQEELPQVISTSYGDSEQTVPEAYAKKVCSLFAQLGARGISVLFSSGDSGVGTNGTCISNDGKNTTQFLPAFPASCPYVTTVGATHEFEPEVVAYRPSYTDSLGRVHNVYSSGGGFSNYFAQPDYQKKVVNKYVKNLGGEFDGLYNKSGRAYPDIAAQGQYFAYFWNGTEGVISGTSASTPLHAGIFALVNDALIAQGKPVLGFLNPWLYKKGFKAYTDITGGSAVGCSSEGFPATEGWDPVTGFGTPIFPLLVKEAGGKLNHTARGL